MAQTGSEETGERQPKGYVLAIDIKSIIIFVSLLSPLVALLTFGLQLRQDVRVNTMTVNALRATLDTQEKRLQDLERAKLVFCAEARADSLQRALAAIGC